MIVTPNNMTDLFQIYTTLNQSLVNILPNLKTRDQTIYGFHNSRGMIPPIISGTGIERDGLSKFLVLNEKSKGLHVPRFVAWDHRLDETVGNGYHVCCGVYCRYCDYIFSFGDV